MWKYVKARTQRIAAVCRAELPKWRQWVVIVGAVASIPAMGYGLKYLDAEEVFGAFAVVLLFAAGAAGWLARFPKNLSEIEHFERRITYIAWIFFGIGLIIGFGSVVLGPHI